MNTTKTVYGWIDQKTYKTAANSCTDSGQSYPTVADTIQQQPDKTGN